MTIKEIAEAAGCSEKTVKRITSEKMPNKMQKGKITRFTWNEAHEIMERLPKRNMVQMSYEPGTNVRGSQNDQIDAFAKIADAMSAIATVVKSIGDRVNVIEGKIEQRQALLPAPGIDTRTHITKIVREFAAKNNIEYRDAWRELYKEFGYRTHSNPSIAAKNRNMTVIDYVDAEGQIETLLSVAMEVLK